MGSIVLTPRFGLEHLATSGRHGAPGGEAGVEVRLRTGVALATVIACKGRASELKPRVKDAFGLELPVRARRVASGSIAFAWAGPGHWLASRAGIDGRTFETRLRGELANLASVSDQSDGRILVRVGGARVRDALAKGLMIDLHPRAFAPGDAAVTSVAHIGVHLWQLDAAPTYEFAVFRSFGAAFWQWLMASASEFGVTVR